MMQAREILEKLHGALEKRNAVGGQRLAELSALRFWPHYAGSPVIDIISLQHTCLGLSLADSIIIMFEVSFGMIAMLFRWFCGRHTTCSVPVTNINDFLIGMIRV